MEFINKVEISNFKSIKNLTLDNCKRINLIVGHPNAGKSNFLEALSLFSIKNHELDFNSLIRIQNLTTLFFDGEIHKQIVVKVDCKHRFIARFRENKIKFEHQFEMFENTFSLNDKELIGLDTNQEVLINTKFEIIEIDESREDKKRWLMLFSDSSLGKENNLIEILKYQFKKLKYTKSDNYRKLDIPFGENIFNLISTNSELRNSVEYLFEPDKLELLFDTREQKFTILKRTNSGIFSIPYEMIADTLQRLIFFKTSIASNKNSVLLFEEPESHMFPTYISNLTNDIFESTSNQFFIATHSPYVINDFLNQDLSELAIHEFYFEDGETKCHTLSQENLDTVYQMGSESIFLNLERFRKDAN